MGENDLVNQYYLKRSKYSVHYIYVPHSLSSLHSIYRKGAFDYFDTLFCVGPHHVKEARKLEEEELRIKILERQKIREEKNRIKLEDIKIYELPYLKDEVMSLMMWIKDNKS